MKTSIIDRTVEEALVMLENGTPSDQILRRLIHGAEKYVGNDSVSSILVLDQQGLLRNGSSPNLPSDYLNAIDGLKPSPNVGTCAAAAATGLMVVTKDFKDDDKWAELKHLPLALGFTCAWSFPIKNVNGKVLGTFGTYFRESREPVETEIHAFNSLANTAAKVLNYQA